MAKYIEQKNIYLISNNEFTRYNYLFQITENKRIVVSYFENYEDNTVYPDNNIKSGFNVSAAPFWVKPPLMLSRRAHVLFDGEYEDIKISNLLYIIWQYLLHKKYIVNTSTSKIDIQCRQCNNRNCPDVVIVGKGYDIVVKSNIKLYVRKWIQ